jgi:hypothetical protein
LKSPASNGGSVHFLSASLVPTPRNFYIMQILLEKEKEKEETISISIFTCWSYSIRSQNESMNNYPFGHCFIFIE